VIEGDQLSAIAFSRTRIIPTSAQIILRAGINFNQLLMAQY